MELIFSHRVKFIDVLDFKLRQCGEVGKTYVPFELSDKIAKIESQELEIKASRIKTLNMIDKEYSERLVLVLCEGTTDSFILKYVLNQLIEEIQFVSKAAIEIKSLGSGYEVLKRLPEIINTFKYAPKKLLSGVIVVLDSDMEEAANKLEQGTKQYIDKMAIPIPYHLYFAKPSIEAWIGLNKERISQYTNKLDVIQNAIHKIDINSLLEIQEIKDMGRFIAEITEPDEPIWESDAREAIEKALENSEWNSQTGIVTISGLDEHEPDIKCESIDELRNALMDIAILGSNESMPYEDGQPFFEIDSWGIVDEVLIDGYEDKIKDMKWEL